MFTFWTVAPRIQFRSKVLLYYVQKIGYLGSDVNMHEVVDEGIDFDGICGQGDDYDNC